MNEKPYSVSIAKISLFINLPKVPGGDDRRNVSIWVNERHGTWGHNDKNTSIHLSVEDMEFIARAIKQVIGFSKALETLV